MPIHLTPYQHDCAEINAYFIALERGGGKLPAYDPKIVAEDYCGGVLRTLTPVLLFRKLWDHGTIQRWDSGLLTSQHPHGLAPEWSEIARTTQSSHSSDYPLHTHFKHGYAMEEARSRFIEMCVNNG
jgi:hypothetical protein